MDKHVLLIPFHFPPIQGSTGAFRSLEFARWLPESGWRVSILTAHTRAYPTVEGRNVAMLGEDMKIIRAFALDAKKHLSVRGRYLKVTALPDRWSSWIVGGVLSGLRSIKRDRPDILYSTYPVSSSHIIGRVLHKLSGIPWIAEFRDPMVEEDYPSDRLLRRVRIAIERKVFESASRIVVVTPGARELYEQKTGRHSGFVVEVQNGFNDALLSNSRSSASRAECGPMTILHSGILYPVERDPSALFVALDRLKRKGAVKSDKVKFVFRGAGNEGNLARQVQNLGIHDIVEFREQIPYELAQREMEKVDAVLLLQSRACNRQIPAKAYEYLALRKPILSLADPAGDTAKLLHSVGLGPSVPLEDDREIELAVARFLENYDQDRIPVMEARELLRFSRRARAADLAGVLDSVRQEASRAK